MTHSADASRRAAHRAEMRASGLRLVEIWVPDTSAPGFAQEARRQSLLVAAENGFDDMMNFIERSGPEPNHRLGATNYMSTEMRGALDTNILAYAEGVNGEARKDAALRILQEFGEYEVVLPDQALGELFVVLIRNAKREAAEVRSVLLGWSDRFYDD
jgi:hypothetical protein